MSNRQQTVKPSPESILQFIANSGRVTSKDVMRHFHILDTEGTPTTRKLIKEALEQCPELGLPIGADRNGYFLLHTPDEFFAYMTNLDNRISGLQKRQDSCRRAWDARKEVDAG